MLMYKSTITKIQERSLLKEIYTDLLLELMYLKDLCWSEEEIILVHLKYNDKTKLNYWSHNIDKLNYFKNRNRFV